MGWAWSGNTTHPYWTHVLTLKQDGTFATDDKGDSGHWILTADGRHLLMLVCKWEDRLGAEKSVGLLRPPHNRGQINSRQLSHRHAL